MTIFWQNCYKQEVNVSIHKVSNCIWNKEELPDQWKKSIIVPVPKKGDETDCTNYCWISLLSTLYKILLRLSQYVHAIIGDHQCRFQHNRSSADHIFLICQIPYIKWEYSEIAHQLFIDFKKNPWFSEREVLYSILIEFGIPMQLVWLIKMCLNETYSKVLIGKHLSDSFPLQNCLK
jgi:hypothetical protein